MHEYHIVENVVKQATGVADERGASRITRVRLAVGELSGLEESSIRLYFDEISKGTLAEGAELIVSPVEKGKEGDRNMYIEDIEIEK
jgi:hydrogenase nickel incorporation protein HypA/HybF